MRLDMSQGLEEQLFFFVFGDEDCWSQSQSVELLLSILFKLFPEPSCLVALVIVNFDNISWLDV